MIIDRIENRAYYEEIHPKISLAFDFIEKVLRDGADVGRYELDGSDVYAMVQEYVGKEDHELFEGHQKYMDIQFVWSGREAVEVAFPSACNLHTAYSEEKDIAFYTCRGNKVTMVWETGDFGIFYPHDLHKPGIGCGDGKLIRKILVKIRIA
jgi:YhcH/YjgK/YiaL family protein